MNKVRIEDVEKLELISSGLDRISKGSKNQIIKDMEWLVKELRRVYLILED